MDRSDAARLGHQASKGGITRQDFAATVNRLSHELQLVALAAYSQERQQPGGPAGYPRQANLWQMRHGPLHACPDKDRWNAATPHAWPAA